MKNKLYLFILISLMCAFFVGCSQHEMNSDELTAKRIIEQSNSGITNIEYVEFLEKINNGYKDYYYYDVVTVEKGKYIVEIKDTGSKKAYNDWKVEYKSSYDKKDSLRDMIEYRCSDLGALGDSIKNY